MELSKAQIDSLNVLNVGKKLEANDLVSMEVIRQYLEQTVCAHGDLSSRIKTMDKAMSNLRAAGLDLRQWDYDGGDGEVWAFDYTTKSMGLVVVVKGSYRIALVGFADGPEEIEVSKKAGEK